ncbi:hypothetical protein EJ02DRAFT_418571 [Clathrospora elynae]|uniref:Uncharacterized protein n=1 Tax=Clathrospora elynae TaxID=706981 RepID=A0A6A5T349_9PLEO|nr:hypothetical protein EJ02DRAFT_418571 [Clathrospora elynae]
MKAMKRTPVPLPSSTAKPKAKDTPSKAPLSQEFIDSDDDVPTEMPAPTKRIEHPKKTMAIHVNGVAKTKSKTSTKEAARPKAASKSKAAPRKPALKQIATQEQAEDLSSSDCTENSDALARDIQTKLPGNEKRMKSSSDSSSDSDSSSGSSSDDSDTPQPAPKPAQARAQAQLYATVTTQPARPYEPPRGFNPVPVNDRTTSKSASIFDNLQGKQLWHFTAPVGIPLWKSVKELEIDKAMGGEAILSHKGTEYAFSQTEKSEDGACEVHVPQKNGLHSVSTRISQTLRLRTVVRLPELSSKQADQNTGSEAAASITQSTIRAPRPQVSGLKMRFLPIGFGGSDAGILGDSDSEVEVARTTAGLGMPDGLNLPSRKKKRKHADVNGVETAEVPSKKTRKHRTPEELQKKDERRAKKEKRRAEQAGSHA